MAEIIKGLGCDIYRDKHGSMRISANITKPKRLRDYSLFSKLRASVLVMSPCLARFGNVRIPLPGGCKIGARPIDLHLKGFAAMGAKIKQGHGFVEASAKNGLVGTRIYLDFPSVGATENLMIAACLANGTTTIENAANEPEIIDLADFLCGMGGSVTGAGSDTIIIKGTTRMHKNNHKIIPDRIEAGTFIICAAGLGSGIKTENIEPLHLKPLLAKLTEMGFMFETGLDFIDLKPCQKPKSVDIKTLPYPGFPTDIQSPFMAYRTTVDGTSTVIETVFENRFMHVSQLGKMGASIETAGNRASIKGNTKLRGCSVIATDLRAGAAMVLAGLVAEGQTEISEIYHIERGYEKFMEKFAELGADIKKVDD